MSLKKYLQEIAENSHMWNWSSDWYLLIDIYEHFPNSYSILTPFAYSYLEELIRSNTSQYGREIVDKDRNEIYRKVGNKLISLAIDENKNNSDIVANLNNLKKYFQSSQPIDCGDNRNSVNHGYLHPRFWNEKSFEELIHDIASFSKYAKF